jgi:glycosyltransferase involved in cell wall biosynthesis
MAKIFSPLYSLIHASVLKKSMITVVIASYGYGHLAAHCVESILSQTVLPARTLFVDDGAQDCFHLEGLYPEIEFIYRKKNLGTVANFQDMLMRVKTEYVLFIGADNWIRSDTIELLSKEKADIVTYDIVVTGELKDEILKRVPGESVKINGDHYWDRQGKHHGSMMYRTSLGKNVKYEKRFTCTTSHPQEDWRLWEQMLANGATVSSIDQGLLFYRRHRENFLKYKTENASPQLVKQQELQPS